MVALLLAALVCGLAAALHRARSASRDAPLHHKPLPDSAREDEAAVNESSRDLHAADGPTDEVAVSSDAERPKAAARSRRKHLDPIDVSQRQLESKRYLCCTSSPAATDASERVRPTRPTPDYRGWRALERAVWPRASAFRVCASCPWQALPVFFQDEAASVYSHGTLPLPAKIRFRVSELTVAHLGSKRAKQAIQVATVDEEQLEKQGPSAPAVLERSAEAACGAVAARAVDAMSALLSTPVCATVCIHSVRFRTPPVQQWLFWTLRRSCGVAGRTGRRR